MKLISNKVYIVYNVLIIGMSIALFSCTNRDPQEKYARFINLALHYDKKGEYQNALNSINNAIELDSTESMAYVIKGRIYNSLGNYHQANNEFDIAIKLDEKNSSAFFYKGLSLSLIGNNQLAILQFNNAINSKKVDAFIFDVKSDTNSLYKGTNIPISMIRFFRGISFYNIKNDSLAYYDFDYALENHYNVPECELYIGVILISKGNVSAGCSHLFKAKSLGKIEADEYIKTSCTVKSSLKAP